MAIDDRHDDLEADQTAIPLPLFAGKLAIAIDHHPLKVHPNTLIAVVVTNLCQGQPAAGAIAPLPADEPKQPASYALVMEGEQLCGIVTERDVVKWVSQGIDLSTTPVSAVMTTALVTLPAAKLNDPLAALEIFRRYHIRHLPIVDDQNHLVGVVMPEHLRQSLQAAHLLRLQPIAEVMTTEVITATADRPAIALAELMTQHQVSCVVIVEPLPPGAKGDRPIGIVTERDIVQFYNLQLDLHTLTAAAVMSAPLVCMAPHDSLWEAHLHMQQMRVQRMVVSHQGRLAGIITQTSILSVLDPDELARSIAILQAEVQRLNDQRLALLQQQATQLSDQLLSSEQRFQAIFDNTFQLTGLLTPDGTLIEVNQAALRFGGLCREQVINRPFWQVDWWAISPQTQTQLQAAIARAAQGEFIRYEVEVWDIHRQPTWLDFSIRPLKDADGQVILLIPEGRDITALKQDQRDLEFQSACNHLIASLSSRFIQLPSHEIAAEIDRALAEIGQLTQIDICYIFRFADTEASLEITHEWLAAGIEPLRRRDQPLAQSAFPWSVQRLLEGETVYVPSVSHLPPEGAVDRQSWQSFGLQSVLTIPLNAHGQIAGAVGFASFQQERQWSDSNIQILQVFADLLTHVMQRQQAEQALEQSEQRFRAFMEHSPTAAWIADVAGRLEYASPTYQRLFSTPPEVIGKDVFELYPQAIAQIYQANNQTVVRTGSVLETVEPGIRPDHSLGEFLVFKFPLPQPSGQIGIGGIAVDITERNSAEEALRQSSQQYSDLVNRIPIGVYTFCLQPDGRRQFEYLSPRWLELNQLDRAAVMADAALAFGVIHPEDLDEFVRLNEESIATASHFVWEGRLVVNGNVRWAHIESSPTRRADGAIAWDGIQYDITDRTIAELAARENEQRYLSLAKAAPVGIFRTDTQGNCVYVNDRWSRISGLTFAEALGPGWINGLHPDDRDQIAQEWYQSAQEQRPFRLEYRFKRSDDSISWVFGQAVAEHDAYGQVTGYIGTITDITERKQTEQQLQASEERLKEAQRIAQLGRWELDLQTNTLLWSDEIYRIFEIEPQQFGATYEAFLAAIHPDDREAVHQAYTDSLVNRTPYIIVHRLLLPDGRIKYVQEQCQTFYDDQGEAIRSMGTIQDITELKATQDSLRVSEERLRLALRATNQGLYDLNLQTGEAIVSAEYATMLGYDPDTFQESNARWIERLHPDDRATVAETYRAYMQGEIPDYAVEFRQRTKTGQWKWILSLGRIVAWDEAGNPLRMLGTHADISDRKQTEEKAQHRLDILEAARDIIASASGTGQVTYLNQAAHELLGIPPDTDVLQTVISDYHPPDVAEFLLQKALPQCAQEGFWAGETQFLRRDGRDFPAWQVIVAHRHQDGSISHFSTIARDITKLKQAEAARLQAENLRLELALLENILDIILAGYWDWDIPSNQKYLSPGLKRMFGYADDELPNTPESWQQLIFAEDLSGLSECFDRHVQSHGQVPYYNEVRYNHKNGSTIWVICSGRVIEWGEDGQPIRMIGCHIDITQRKQAEQQLRKSDAHLKTAQRIGKLGSWEFDLRTEHIIWSDEVYRIFGRDPDAVVPSFEELQDYLHPDDRILHQQSVQTAIETGQTYEIEFRIYRLDGTLRYLQARGEPILDATGQLIQLVGTVLDITERKQAEEELRNLSDRLTLAIKSAAIAIWDWNVPDNILDWDDRMYELYGITANQFTSAYDAWSNSLHPEDRPMSEQAIQQALTGEKDFDLEFRVVHPDGTIRYIKAYALVQRNNHGEPQHMIGINFDITDRKLAEMQILQTTAQLEASNRELEAFAYSVSHDLRSPLRAIDGFSRALLEDYGHQFDGDGKDYFDRIRSNISRMGMLIDDLLRLSRVSRSEMHYSAVNLSDLAQEQIRDLQAADPHRQVNVAIAPDLTIEADGTLMRVVLANLLQNAWKFTSHHPTAQIEFGVLRDGEQPTYFVRDDGAGFDMTYSNKLFGVFQRLHNTHEFPGTGIGLATVQRAIHRHGGQVWAEGAIERGTTVYFTLPHPLPHRSLEV